MPLVPLGRAESSSVRIPFGSRPQDPHSAVCRLMTIHCSNGVQSLLQLLCEVDLGGLSSISPNWLLRTKRMSPWAFSVVVPWNCLKIGFEIFASAFFWRKSSPLAQLQI